MGHVKGRTWRSCSEVLTTLFIHGDQTAEELRLGTNLNRKTVFAVLKLLLTHQFIRKIPTGDRNKVRYHLPGKNYGRAMASCGWEKTRWPKRLPGKLQKKHEALARSPMNEKALRLLDNLQLTTTAKRCLFSVGLIGDLATLDSIREGHYCLNCLNSGQGLQPTASRNIEGGQLVYLCGKCGMEQESLRVQPPDSPPPTQEE